MMARLQAFLKNSDLLVKPDGSTAKFGHRKYQHTIVESVLRSAVCLSISWKERSNTKNKTVFLPAKLRMSSSFHFSPGWTAIAPAPV